MTIESRLQQRNHQIGAILMQARLHQKRTVTECAALLGTSRRRYSAMERGEVAISFVEMEILMEYLHLPGLPVAPKVLASSTPQVIVEMGEGVEEIIVRRPKDGSVSIPTK